MCQRFKPVSSRDYADQNGELASSDSDGTAAVRCGIGNDAASDKNGNCDFAKFGQLPCKDNPSQRAEKTADGNYPLSAKTIGGPSSDQAAKRCHPDQHHRKQAHDPAAHLIVGKRLQCSIAASHQHHPSTTDNAENSKRQSEDRREAEYDQSCAECQRRGNDDTAEPENL